MDARIGAIYETTNYDQFKKLEGNRDAKMSNKVIQSINTVGYVLSPILVNEKFEVIDGQNRLNALKELGLPVHYIVQSGIGLDECRSMNTGRSNWTISDYIFSYAESGNKNYQRLASLVTEFGSKFTIEGICSFVIGIYNSGSMHGTLVKEGKAEISEKLYELTRTRLQSAIDLGFTRLQKENKLVARSWYAAVAYAYNHPDVSVKELASKMSASPLEIVSYSKVVDQLALFDKIYNKKKISKRIFMATDLQRGLYLKPTV